MLRPPSLIRLPASQRPILLAVVDTEEEFDWSRPPDRSSTVVRSLQRIDRVQDIFDAYRIRPGYLVDYPVATQADGIEPLSEILRSGRCTIGAHLHPWVNPPYTEELCPRNTYAGNLSRELEAEKLRILSRAIEDGFGVRPTVYKAGRYGVGPHTASILEAEGYEADASVCPPLDSSADGGPDFSAAGAEPYWFGERSRLLELPLTGSFTGVAGRFSAPIHRRVTGRLLTAMKCPGILARLHLLDRLILSPEGFTPAEHRKLTQWLLDRGVRTFTWSFHSPSVVPEKTPYVRSAADLDEFLDSFRRYFDYFFGELGGVTMTLHELRDHLERHS